MRLRDDITRVDTVDRVSCVEGHSLGDRKLAIDDVSNERMVEPVLRAFGEDETHLGRAEQAGHEKAGHEPQLTMGFHRRDRARSPDR